MEILTKTVLSLLCLVHIGGNVDSLNNDGQQFHQYKKKQNKV
jgi:hypothetical protein